MPILARLPMTAALGAALAVASPALAAERVVTLDPKASEIKFTLDATLHTVHGSLRLTRGELRFDPDTGAASGTIEADATSSETSNARRDRNMHVNS